jgi:hypothetical protein
VVGLPTEALFETLNSFWSTHFVLLFAAARFNSMAFRFWV